VTLRGSVMDYHKDYRRSFNFSKRDKTQRTYQSLCVSSMTSSILQWSLVSTTRRGGSDADVAPAAAAGALPEVTELTASVTELAAAAACDRMPRVMSCTLDSVGKLEPLGMDGLRPGRFILCDEWSLAAVLSADASSRSWYKSSELK